MASRQSSKKTGRSRASRKNASDSFHVPGWLWCLVGVIAGFAGAQYLQRDAPPPRDEDEIAAVVARKTDGAESGGAESEGASNRPTNERRETRSGEMPTFEFYTLLPESEVISPGVTPSAPRPGTEGAVIEQHASRVAETTTATAEPPGSAESEPARRADADAGGGGGARQPDAIQRIVAQRSQQQRSAEGPAYMLQAASFQSRGDADGMSSRLEDLGLNARVTQVQTADNATWYRVQAGPYRDDGELARARSLMQSNGIEPLQLRQR